MKRLLNQAIALMALVLTTISCNQKDYLAEDLDFTPSLNVEQPLGIYKNSPVKMNLKFNSDNENVLNDLAVTYSIKDGSGYILVDGSEVAPGVEFTPTKLDGNKLPFFYMPSVAGAQTITFKVKTSHASRSTSLDVFVEEIYYKVKVENMPTTPKLGRKESFDIVINLAEDEESSIKTCKATATVTKGAGKVEYNNSELSSTPISMTLGRNTISYTSSVRGENIIQINLHADNGYKQPIYIPVMIDVPEYNITIHQDENDAITAGKDYSFTVNLNEDGLNLENEYTIGYRFIKNNGVIKINNKEIAPGEVTQCKSGSNIIVYNGSEGGDADIEFIVKDKYNTERKTNARLNLAFGKITVVTEKLGEAVEMETTPLDLIINETGYTGKYEFSCTVVKGSAKLLWKDTEIASDGTWVKDFSRSEILNIKPLISGELQLRIKIKDSKSVISDPISVIYNVKPQEAITITTEGIVPVEVDEKLSFKFKALKADYQGSFSTTFEIVNGAGSLKVNNIIRQQNTAFNIPSGEVNMEYTPSSVGNNTLEFSLSQGGITKKYTLNIVCIETPKTYNVSVTTAQAHIISYYYHSLPQFIVDQDYIVTIDASLDKTSKKDVKLEMYEYFFFEDKYLEFIERGVNDKGERTWVDDPYIIIPAGSIKASTTFKLKFRNINNMIGQPFFANGLFIHKVHTSSSDINTYNISTPKYKPYIFKTTNLKERPKD